MAINKNSNIYTIIYTVVMVVIVASLLACLSTMLKPMQDANILNDQKVSIMKAFGVDAEKVEADKMIEMFDKDVQIALLNPTEDKANLEGKELEKYAFGLLSKRTELAAAIESGKDLPYFSFDGKCVLPLVGKGLWGDIWGYIALQPKDGNIKVAGIVMDHAGETPGLGAEIATADVQKKFLDKNLWTMDKGEWVKADKNIKIASLMLKGGMSNKEAVEGSTVDAISGGTKTCDGVNAMLQTSLQSYESYLLTLVADVQTEAPECEACDKQCEECDQQNCDSCDKQCEKKAECEKQCEKKAECAANNCETK
jgi:Na+-transporting NADH:ubiquinone oxidoreductase subunit C